MTQQQVLLFLSVSPVIVAVFTVGLAAGYIAFRRRLSAGFDRLERPSVRVRGTDCRVVTEWEYQWLKACNRLRDVRQAA